MSAYTRSRLVAFLYGLIHDGLVSADKVEKLSLRNDAFPCGQGFKLPDSKGACAAEIMAQRLLLPHNAEALGAFEAELDKACGVTAQEAVRPKSVDLSFSEALVALKAGRRIARSDWNGKGMFLFLIHGNDRATLSRPAWTYTDGAQDNYPNASFIAMKTADDKVTPWLASQADMLAEDWGVVLQFTE